MSHPADLPVLPRILGRPYRYIRLAWDAELSLLRVRTCV